MKSSRDIPLSHLILDKLYPAGELVLSAIFPYHRAEGRLWRKLLGLPEDYRFSKKTFSVTLARLKKQGLVANTGWHNKTKWVLTARGKTALEEQKTLRALNLPKPDGMPRLVMFDIPESEKRKRGLIRTALTAYDFKLLQKSVWLGFAPLPEDFIKWLGNLNLKDKVHIVSIHKKGTLENVF